MKQLDLYLKESICVLYGIGSTCHSEISFFVLPSFLVKNALLTNFNSSPCFFLDKVSLHALQFCLVQDQTCSMPFPSFICFLCEEITISGAKELIKDNSHSQVCFRLFTKRGYERSLFPRGGLNDCKEKGSKMKSNNLKNNNMEFEIKNINLSIHF